MALLRLERFLDDGQRTIGRLYVNGEFFCHTLEDTYRKPKIKGKTRIWAGVYTLKPRLVGGFYQRYIKRFAPWHKGMIWIIGVIGFKFILIHPGNTEDNTEGCILVGTWNAPDKWITASAATYERLYKKIYEAVAAGGTQIEIVDLDR